MKLVWFLVAASCCAVATHCLSVTPYGRLRRYDGDKVVAFPEIDDWAHVLRILDRFIPSQEQDVWKSPSRSRPGYVQVPLSYWPSVQNELIVQNIHFSVHVDDVQSLISKSQSKKQRHGQKLDIVGTFPTYDQLLTWMSDLAVQYPELASTYSIGNTYEGRPMQVLQLGLAGTNKWKIWLDSGMHAREWIAVTTAVYVVDQLVQGYAGSNAEIVSFLQTFDFIILPSANPDGYVYTHTTDRAWRKNRKPDQVNGTGCIGVDLNRNFNFQWGGANSDPDPCASMFMGPYPESEIEVQNIVNFLLASASSFIWYHSYHSWGEQFFTRWDYTADEVPPDHDELLALAWKAVDAINAVHAQVYEAGTAPELMYAFSGSSADWSRGVAQIKYPYLQELRDANGTYSFYPPPEEIIPCGEENWAGYLVVLREVMLNYGGISPPSKEEKTY